ncbi:MAG: glutamate--cysteine ligase, partial [Rhodospirillales bacterium]
MLCIAHEGLANRGQLDWLGMDETHFLNPLIQIAESGVTAAEEMLGAYERLWKGDIDRIYNAYAY